VLKAKARLYLLHGEGEWMRLHPKKVNLHLLAGVTTASLFMESHRIAVTAQPEEI
jgi:ABC-type uncharacterized transport system auxiliary subunit